MMFTVKFAVGQTNCVPDLIPFKSGESVSYNIQYHWGFIWLTAGEVTFSVENAFWKDFQCFHFQGIGKTYDNYDWFYKVRDKYESWCDVKTLQTYEYKRKVYEGGYEVENHYVFDNEKELIYTDGLRAQKEVLKDTFNLSSCLFDVMTLVYYCRCIDFSKHKEGELIPMSIILDNELHNINIKYLGEETIEVNDEEVNTHKFSSELIAGSIFNEGDEMTIWVSDDGKQVPLKVKAEIMVGAIEANIK